MRADTTRTSVSLPWLGVVTRANIDKSALSRSLVADAKIVLVPCRANPRTLARHQGFSFDPQATRIGGQQQPNYLSKSTTFVA